MPKSCFFIGHREAPESLLPILAKEVERHFVEYGVSSFIVGHYGHFDRLAARAVIEIKEKHDGISLTMLLPDPPAEKVIALPKGFDGSVYPEGQESVPRRFAIVRANRWAIKQSDYLIIYAIHPGSNAMRFLEYARGQERNRKMAITQLRKRF